MKRLFYLLLFIVMLVIGMSFAVKNPQIVEVHYYFDFHHSLSLSILLLIVLALGACLGALFTLSWVVRARRQTARARRDLRKMEEEVANLRSLPIKGNV